MNVFFDNIGGRFLDLMLTRVARHGRIAACGTISNYSSVGGGDVEAAGIDNWFQVVVNRLEIKGIITFDLGERAGEYVDKLIQAVKEGQSRKARSSLVTTTISSSTQSGKTFLYVESSFHRR